MTDLRYCECGLVMYLVGKGDGAFACRVCDVGMVDLPRDDDPWDRVERAGA